MSLQNLVWRSTGRRLWRRALEKSDVAELLAPLDDINVRLAVESTQTVVRCLDVEVCRLEQEVLRQIRPDPLFGLLKSVSGVGNILAPTIRLETGEISRFADAGHYVSYCRCVGSRHLRNDKTKGRGNTKNGNPYLAWAWLEAATFSIRYHAPIRRFFERKQARTHRVVALKTVAHKLARAGYYGMHDRVPFQIQLAFGSMWADAADPQNRSGPVPASLSGRRHLPSSDPADAP